MTTTVIILLVVALGVSFYVLAQKNKSHQKEIEKLNSAHEKSIAELKNGYELKFNTQEASFSKEKSDFETKIESERRKSSMKIDSLQGDIRNLTEKNGNLESEIQKRDEFYARIQALHPNNNFEEEVHEMIENEFKASAAEVDEKIAQVIKNPADKDSIDVFKNAISIYDEAIPDVKKYVTSDMEKLHSLYEESIELKKAFEKAEKEKRDRAAAMKAYEEIKAICRNNKEANYQNYEVLRSAYDKYDRLSSDEKEFFVDIQLIHNLREMVKVAETDFNNVNAARKAEKEAERIVNSIYNADEDDRDKLSRALRFYQALSVAQQAYFSADLVRKIKKLSNDAENDHRRQEERREEEARRRREEAEARRRREEAEERRRRDEARRRSSYSSSSMSHHSSSSHVHHSGHGGRPSGGGASRKF